MVSNTIAVLSLQSFKVSNLGEDPASVLVAETSVLQVRRLIPYPPFRLDDQHIEDEVLNDYIFEHRIPAESDMLNLEDCAHAIIQQSKMMKIRNETMINVSSLVPDLVLAFLPESEDLTADIDIRASSSLGRGSFSSVRLGYHGENKVALKIFTDTDVDLVLTTIREDSQAEDQENEQTRANMMQLMASVQSSTISRVGGAAVSDYEVTRDRTGPPQLQPHQCLKFLTDMAQEVAVMKQLQHKNIVQFRGVLFEPYPCLVMEYAPAGSLATLISKYSHEIEAKADHLEELDLSGIAHDGILGRELTHRVSFQVRRIYYKLNN